jgi:hypothetical protein
LVRAPRRRGAVSHIEVRGPDYKGSLTGGRKTLFRFGGAGEGWHRLALTEPPIDALSLATIESIRTDTLYAAPGGGMGPGTLDAIRALLGGPVAVEPKVRFRPLSWLCSTLGRECDPNQTTPQADAFVFGDEVA